jgi:hypothetical protein
LRAEDISAAEERDLQLSLQDMLSGQGDILGVSADTAREYANRALAQHQQRVSKAYHQHRAALTAEEERLKRRAASLGARPPAPAAPDPAITELKTSITRLKRFVSVLVVTMCLAIAVFGLGASHALHGKRLGAAIVGVVLFFGIGCDYASNVKRKWHEPVGALTVSVALTILPIFI